VFGCKILAENLEGGQVRNGRKKLLIANTQFQIWKLGKGIE
jgi:hypothetical protein